MTKDEAKALVKQRIKNAEEKEKCAFDKKEYDVADWYSGMARGYRETLEIIGMIDNDHNRKHH